MSGSMALMHPGSGFMSMAPITTDITSYTSGIPMTPRNRRVSESSFGEGPEMQCLSQYGQFL